MDADPAEAEGFIDVSRLLAPRSVAVIGASDQPGNLGGAAVRFFCKFASPCAVWPVNPGRDSVAGLPCFGSVADLPEPTDLAILAVPAIAVLQVVRDCAAAGIAWAGGFKEGGESGAALQTELAALCRQTGFALLGPNCIGIIDSHTPMTASFASMMLERIACSQAIFQWSVKAAGSPRWNRRAPCGRRGAPCRCAPRR